MTLIIKYHKVAHLSRRKTMTDKKRVTAYLTDEVSNIVQQRAQAENRSVSNYLEQIITKACHEGTPEANKAE